MKKNRSATKDADMRDHYDFSAGVRGKYAARFAEGTNVIVLDPDVAKVFPDAEAVNRALRLLAASVPKATKARTSKKR
jgi:hypothetical protein